MSEKLEHTPGPWTMRGDRFTGWSIEPEVVQQGGDDFGGIDGGILDEADARLIAAAPDLLAAAERVSKAFRPGAVPLGEQAAALHDLDAAIAKAKGNADG